MENMTAAVEMPQDVREELYALLDELTPQQVVEYARRVEEGQFEGVSFRQDGCGCAYGTRDLIRSPKISEDAISRRVEKVRLKMRGEVFLLTPLERFAYEISAGDTPYTNAHSAALYAAVLDYMVLRQARENGVPS